jgi:hypothetical protein
MDAVMDGFQEAEASAPTDKLQTTTFQVSNN